MIVQVSSERAPTMPVQGDQPGGGTGNGRNDYPSQIVDDGPPNKKDGSNGFIIEFEPKPVCHHNQRSEKQNYYKSRKTNLIIDPTVDPQSI